MSVSEALSKADDATLQEILREAESYLNAQLTAGIAADQRAVAFAGMVAAGAVVLASGGVTVLLGTTAPPALGWLGITASLVLLFAAFMAILAAMPGQFWYAGNTPSEWVSDVLDEKPLAASLAEMAEYYSDQISSNKSILDRNGKQMRAAVWIAWGGLVGGAILMILVLLVPALFGQPST